eukprot:13548504-Ditylum_brightwellii.AAC.1
MLELTEWHTYRNADKAHKNILLSMVEPKYTNSLHKSIMGFTNQSTADVLRHLYQNYNIVMPTMMKQMHSKMMQSLNPGMPIKDLF